MEAIKLNPSFCSFSNQFREKETLNKQPKIERKQTTVICCFRSVRKKCDNRCQTLNCLHDKVNLFLKQLTSNKHLTVGPCFRCRMELEYESSSPKALLRISPVEIEDEADYKCEITYWEVREDCETVHIIKLKTLGEYW